MAQMGNGAALLGIARSFRPRILAERDRIEIARRLPKDFTRGLTGAGFFRIYLPAAYGGLDLSPTEGTEIFEELARADASVDAACGTAIPTGLPLNSRRKLRGRSTRTPKSSRRTALALAARGASSTADSMSAADGR
jgi:alkylation response protein AidB-like acyl-CoA dehydrogenase